MWVWCVVCYTENSNVTDVVCRFVCVCSLWLSVVCVCLVHSVWLMWVVSRRRGSWSCSSSLWSISGRLTIAWECTSVPSQHFVTHSHHHRSAVSLQWSPWPPSACRSTGHCRCCCCRCWGWCCSGDTAADAAAVPDLGCLRRRPPRRRLHLPDCHVAAFHWANCRESFACCCCRCCCCCCCWRCCWRCCGQWL